MIAARELGANSCRVLKYADSGHISGDLNNVVGYVSAVFAREVSGAGENGRKQNREKDEGSAAPTGQAGDLSRKDKLFLLKLARRVIESRLEDSDLKIDPPPSPVLKEKRGAFVTLKKKGNLRGCIGYIDAFKPLLETITDMASSAAFDDYRFPPVQAGELDDIEIEISVLSPIVRIEDIAEIEVGKHGIIITRGRNRGLLLPQVATEQGWDRDTFLRHTCLKAGLDQGAWKKPGTMIEIFSARIFSEKEMGLR
ncbi:MAG: AmmeMemoRadiSam system protein A [Candidatus Krumholzibacteriota bacterium]|nr:AmmeMemoRadiSam system protein A [Candidatus Krumholzibacteriota bacterium]